MYHSTRFIGIALAGALMYAIATIFNLPLFPVIAITAFVLTVDGLIVRAISAWYMRSVMDQMMKDGSITVIEKKDEE